MTPETTDFETAAPEPLRFERRTLDRWPMTGVADAYRVGGMRFGENATLRLLDCSDDAFGAASDRPLEPGAVVAVSFRTPGYATRLGHVVRCLPAGDGYRVAVRFERRLAA